MIPDPKTRRTRAHPALPILPAFLFLCLAGCSSGPKYLVKEYQPPAKVAVLPFSNLTNDVGGPETVRKLLIQMLPGRGYHPKNPKEVDRILLEEFGISQGGQLTSVTPQEMGKAMDVDGLFFGNLLTFIDIPLGFTRRRSVKSNIKLYDVHTGDLLWEDEKRWSTPEVHLSVKEAKKAAAKQVAERQLQKMRGTFLRRESRLMLKRILSTLPPARK